MRVLELRAENIKNLKAIEIKPGEDAVVLTGKNGAGKSAILDSIFMALTGKKIEEPIRNGEKRASIEVDLGNYKVKRIYTEKTDRLEVLSKEGAPMKSPQTLLNTILGNLSFDPLDFANMREKEQRVLLAKLVGLDFTELNKDRERLYNERTIKHREIKGSDIGQYRDDPFAPLPLESLVGQMEVPEQGTPRQEISMATEIQKIKELEDKAEKFREYKELIESDKNDIRLNNEYIERTKKEIQELQERINSLQGQITKTEQENAGIQKRMDSVKAPEEITRETIDQARAALADIEAKNVKIRKAIEYDKKQSELKAAKQVIKDLEDGMMKIDIEKDKRLKEAKFPIEGLSLTDECVTFNSKPFSQLSTGEQIRVSTAIAMALNPELKIILIRDGSLLDAEGLKTVIDIAKGRDYQLWIEKVADEKGVGIYIEDGEIKQ